MGSVRKEGNSFLTPSQPWQLHQGKSGAAETTFTVRGVRLTGKDDFHNILYATEWVRQGEEVESFTGFSEGPDTENRLTFM